VIWVIKTVDVSEFTTTGGNITGGTANDNLTGGTSADTIIGGAGTDTITGGVGADQMTGGTSPDDFIQTGQVDDNQAINADVITDFHTGGETGTPIDQIGRWSVANLNSIAGFGSLVKINSTTSFVAGGDAVGLTKLTAGAFATATAVATGHNIIWLDDAIINANDLETALEAGGTFAMTFSTGIAESNGFLVIYDDNITTAHLAIIQSGLVAAGNTAAAGTLIARNLVTFEGPRVRFNWDSSDFLGFVA
jgi:hypothetical protein